MDPMYEALFCVQGLDIVMSGVVQPGRWQPLDPRQRGYCVNDALFQAVGAVACDFSSGANEWPSSCSSSSSTAGIY